MPSARRGYAPSPRRASRTPSWSARCRAPRRAGTGSTAPRAWRARGCPRGCPGTACRGRPPRRGPARPPARPDRRARRGTRRCGRSAPRPWERERNPWAAGYAIRCAERYNVYMQERQSGRALLAHVDRAFTITMTLSQCAGAAVVFVYLTLVLPVHDPPPLDDVILWNWPLGVVYLAASAFVAPRWGRSIARSRLEWLPRGGAPPPEGERGPPRRAPAHNT